jgi:hypothetical protein
VSERARWESSRLLVAVAIVAMAAGVMGAIILYRTSTARRAAAECRPLAEAHYLTNRPNATAEDAAAGMTVTFYEGCLTTRRSGWK